MTPSTWSVLVIFVLAPLGVALLITAAVLLLVSSTPPPAVEPGVGSQDEGSEKVDERDGDTADEEHPPR